MSNDTLTAAELDAMQQIYDGYLDTVRSCGDETLLGDLSDNDVVVYQSLGALIALARLGLEWQEQEARLAQDNERRARAGQRNWLDDDAAQHGDGGTG